MKNINNQIRAANENTENLILGEFNFHPKQILNKTLIFNITHRWRDKNRIIDALNDPYNDRYWIEHEPGTNYFTLGLEDGRWKSTEISKNYIQ